MRNGTQKAGAVVGAGTTDWKRIYAFSDMADIMKRP